MRTQIVEQSLYEHLKEDAERLFGFRVLQHLPINRGWLNQKWKIETDQGTFLLKEYNAERFKKYDLKTIQLALQMQNRAFLNGIRCPELLEHEGNLLHESTNGELFTVMRFIEGSLIKAGEALTNQMESLGDSVGKLHNLLNDGILPSKSATMFQIPSIQDRLNYWETVLVECNQKGLDHLRPFIRLQKEATNKMNPADLENLIPGWCHRDLWVDNLLFSSDSVTGILDFDRMNYDYMEVDIGRIVISTCLNKDTLNREAVHAFIKGYCNTNKLSIERLIRSLKVVWYLESTWWISVTIHEGNPPKRFAQEMNWLAQHLEELETILLGKN